jgi:hypothetical protein
MKLLIAFLFLVINFLKGFRQYFKTRNRFKTNNSYYLKVFKRTCIFYNLDNEYDDLNNESPEHEMNGIKTKMIDIIERSWSRVTRFMPECTLMLCEDELRSLTTLLVLATVRRFADDNPYYRNIIEEMFRAADVNNDGQLTFIEWFEWLSDKSVNADKDYVTSAADCSRNEIDTIPKSKFDVDPIIAALGLVLSHAVCTVKVASRISNDASILSAAFVAGGILSGVLDSSISRIILDRLNDNVR